MQKDSTLLILF